MSWLHCFWGVGTIVSPFVMSYALATSTWHNGYRIVGFVQLGIAALLLLTLPVWKVNQNAAAETQKKIGLPAAVKIRGVPFLLIGFFAYCAAEATTMGWASTYFAEVKGVSADQAAQYASLFYIGITVSRFLSGFVSEKLGDRKLILTGTAILTWRNPSADDSGGERRRDRGVYRDRLWLRADLSVHYPFHAV